MVAFYLQTEDEPTIPEPETPPEEIETPPEGTDEDEDEEV